MEMPFAVAADPSVTADLDVDVEWAGRTGLEHHAEVLVAAPSTADTRRLLARLADLGHPVQLTADAPSTIERLRRNDGPSILIVDDALGGVRLIRRLRAAHLDRYVYAMLLVGDDEAAALAGREAGADDCIRKPIDTRELQAYLRAGQRIASMERRLVEARDRFRAQARRDALTGLANRLDIMETLGREVSRSTRERDPVAVVMVDLDHFKRINDNYGHQVGDDVIREAALRMNRAVRDYDCVGRYGGEEFLVVVSRADAAVAETVARRLREAIREAPFHTQAGLLEVSASFGVASALGFEADAEELVGRADAALYAAKAAGRDRVVTAPSLVGVRAGLRAEDGVSAREALG